MEGHSGGYFFTDQTDVELSNERVTCRNCVEIEVCDSKLVTALNAIRAYWMLLPECLDQLFCKRGVTKHTASFNCGALGAKTSRALLTHSAQMSQRVCFGSPVTPVSQNGWSWLLG